MSGDRSHVMKERGFLLLLMLLCAVITLLQFNWTGALAKAEFDRLGENQREGAMKFSQEFDRELAASVKALTPQSNELAEKAVAKSMMARVKRWRMGAAKPMFSRIAVAIPTEQEVALHFIDPSKGTLIASEWPEAWADLEADLVMKLEGPGGPFGMDGVENGIFFEIPVHRRPGRTGPGGPVAEAGWLILELDEKFLRESYFPELVETFLEPGAKGFYQVRILDGHDGTVFSTGNTGDPDSTVEVPFHLRGREAKVPGGPVWKLEVRRKSGELERMVASSRTRNLALAFAVNGLILLAGLALVRHSRKSRLLAEAQMAFVANVSHELRTPVTVIMGAAHNLKRGIVKSPEAVERYAGMITRHAEQLSEMVQEVLEFSAAKKGKTAYVMVPVDVLAILREALEEAKPEMADMTVEISLPERSPKMKGDAAALKRAFGNLIRNAAKHGGSGGWIGVRAERKRQTRFMIGISDRGPGIPEEEQDSVFEPFFRGEAAREQQIRGSGIGLGLVKEIIEAHRGEVSVCSEPGSGAMFTVVLPVAAPSADERENPVG
ncbi:MAG TPA: HAMP domain-containing sensor histidine kinase [Luteolibacter sp.]|nr:HAMP domain-containing sensor histidine kinase [Luteolibacter sp.]